MTLLARFHTEQEATALANNTWAGLAGIAYIHTNYDTNFKGGCRTGLRYFRKEVG